MKKLEGHSSRRPVVGISQRNGVITVLSGREYGQHTTEQTLEQATAHANTDPLPHAYLWKTSFRNGLIASHSDPIHDSPVFQLWEKEPHIMQSNHVAQPKQESWAENREEDGRHHGCLWQEPEDRGWTGRCRNTLRSERCGARM